MVDELPERYSKCTEILESEAVPDKTVYHYTTWAGLTGILKKQQLWLTDVAHLNDTSEVKYAIRTLQNYILLLPLAESTKQFF